MMLYWSIGFWGLTVDPLLIEIKKNGGYPNFLT